MFVTSDDRQVPVPEVISGPGNRSWGAVSLSVEMPWFVFTQRIQFDGQSILHSTLVACRR